MTKDHMPTDAQPPTPSMRMREALIAAKCTSPDGTFVYASMEDVLCAARPPAAPVEATAYKCGAGCRGACNWPICECDPHANEIKQALIDDGWTPEAPPQCSAGTDHIDWDILAEERLGQRPIAHGRHIPQTSPAPGCDSGSLSAATGDVPEYEDDATDWAPKAVANAGVYGAEKLPPGVSIASANKAIEFLEWLSGYIGHGPAIQISSDQMEYIRSKVHPLVHELDGRTPAQPQSSGVTQEEDCGCIGAVIGQHERSCPLSRPESK